jgi:hypothetical protein
MLEIAAFFGLIMQQSVWGDGEIERKGMNDEKISRRSDALGCTRKT